MINLDLSKAVLWGGGILGLLAALFAGWLYISGLRNEVTRLEARVGQVSSEREEARRVAQANADAAEAIKADAERQLAAVQDELSAERQRHAQFAEIKEEVRHVPPAAQSCPVDPAVLRALDRLRQRPATHGDGSEIHPPGNTRGTP